MNANLGFTSSLVVAPPASQPIASDNGGNYSVGGWTNGANGGSGFGPWIFSSGTTNGGSAGGFIGNPTNAGIGGMSSDSFGLFANPPTNANFVNVSRAFPRPLAVGDSFSFQWGNNYDAGANGNKGLNITGVSGSNLFNLNMGGSAAITLSQGTNAPIEVQPPSAYGTNVMPFTFAQTATNTFTVSAPAGRDLGPGFTNTFSVTNQAVGFAFYASGLQNDGNPTNRDSAQPYFNELRVAESGGGGTPIFVRIAAAAPVTNNLSGNILLSSFYDGTNRTATNSVSVQGRVRPVPGITLSPTSLSFYNVEGYPSGVKSVRITGSNLLANVVVTPPSGIEISRFPDTGWTNSLTLTNSAGSINTTNYVRVAFDRADGPITGSVTFVSQSTAPPFTASASLPLSGRTGQPADNDIFVQTMFELMLYDDPTPAQMTEYLGVLGGPGDAVASNAKKAEAMMRLAGFRSTASPFPWQTAFDWQGQYARSAGIVFSLYGRLGVTPQPAHTADYILPFIDGVLSQPSSPGLNIGPANGFDGIPYRCPFTATVALAGEVETFMNAPFIPSQAKTAVSSTIQPYFNWLIYTMFGGAFATTDGTQIQIPAMLESYGMLIDNTTSSTRAAAAGIAFRSVYMQVITGAESQSLLWGDMFSTPTAQAWVNDARGFQQRLTQAALNFQLWNQWGFSGSSAPVTQVNVAGLLRAPVISSSASQVVIPRNVPFGDYLPLDDETAPINAEVYFAVVAGTVPPGLFMDPDGFVYGTPTTAGVYPLTIAAQNIGGTSTRQITITVDGSEAADGWMAFNYPLSGMTLYQMRDDDTDQDGFNTLTEYAFGTGPNQPTASVMDFTRNGQVTTIDWLGLEGATNYVVQSSTNLMLPWVSRSNIPVQTVGSPFSTNGADYQPMRSVITNTTDQREFYRIKADFTQQELD